jgi:hypothetical protein
VDNSFLAWFEAIIATFDGRVLRRWVQAMRCVVCGAEMHLLRIAADKTMMVPDYVHHSFECSACREVEHRLTFTRASRLLKKVFGRSRCATLSQRSISGRTKDSSPRDFGFENCASSADFRVFQQPARSSPTGRTVQIHYDTDQTAYTAKDVTSGMVVLRNQGSRPAIGAM